jgi:hypothetical protein
MSEAKPGGDASDPRGREYVGRAQNPIGRATGESETRRTARVGDPAADAPTEKNERISRTDWNPIMRGALLTLLGLMALLLLALLLNGMGWLRLPGAGQATVATPELILDDPAPDAGRLGGAAEAYPGPPATIPSPGPPPGPPPSVGARFEGFFVARGGERVLGRPIAEPMVVNGREIQWFERARVEHWPEFAGTPYELQLGRLGVEFTAGRTFASQGYFVSTPELRYFPETGHAVGGAFLRFYDGNGGLDAFGYPISEEFDEVLPDGRAYRVQYFERARMEFHPELAGTPYEVQLGLLGTALYRNESRPSTVQPVPTPVP